LALAIGCAACGADGADGNGGPIRLEVNLLAGQAWIATGDVVDAGAMCPAGSRRLVGYLDDDGTPLSIAEAMARMQPVFESGDPAAVDFRLVVEWACSNGSGSFTTTEEPRDGGSWEILHGTGAYGSLRTMEPGRIQDSGSTASPDAWGEPSEIVVLTARVDPGG
jgi:hypothetical protein